MEKANEKVKVFISLPMKGLTEAQIKKNMKDIFLKYFNPDKAEMLDQVMDSGSPLKNMAHSLEVMDQADIVVITDPYCSSINYNRESFTGAKIEHACALHYNKVFFINGSNIKFGTNDNMDNVKKIVNALSTNACDLSLTDIRMIK